MKNAGFFVASGTAAFFLSVYAGCSHFSKYRAPANSTYGAPAVTVSSEVMDILTKDSTTYGGNIRFPTGLNADEALELWHLSEGSDVYPLRWFMTMRSQFSNMAGETYLFQDLDKKFGVIRESDEMARRSPFPLKFVGLSASWSEAHPTQADVRVYRGQKVEDFFGVRDLPDGKKSIAMVGVNCTFCHSNEIKLNGKTHFMEGAPNMLNIRGFFQDMFASTAKTMLTADLLEEFLNKNNVQGDVKTIAQTFSSEFKKELGLTGLKQEILGRVLNRIDSEFYNGKKAQTLRKAMFENRLVVENRLVRLMQLTYGLREPSIELRYRMRFLANSIGIDPDLATTPEGFARTDAFGRISNLVARTKNPIPLTATSSVPPMWNIEFRALFHWNANTNSVVMRNIGQSFGLGALLTNPGAPGVAQFDSTSNIHNLHKLEGYLYKIQTPDWIELGGHVDLDKVRDGCVTFHQTCAGCHMPDRERVGPQRALIEYKLIPAERIGTDMLYSENQSTPVNGQKFKDALFNFTRAVRDRYYERYNVSRADQADWEKRELRGPELFRDTIFGEKGQVAPSEYMNIDSEPKPGYPARHLAAVWATAPYLHNGSVPNMYELLKPAHARPKIFFVGNREYNSDRLGFLSDFQSLPPIPNLEEKAQALLDQKQGIINRIKGVKLNKPANILEAKIQVACSIYPERCFVASHAGNSNAGHDGPEYGTSLSDKEKRSLIEFMKVLRPEVEYSRNLKPVYSWNGQTCEVMARN